MTEQENITELRNELLKNCQSLLDELTTSENLITKGIASLIVSTENQSSGIVSKDDSTTTSTIESSLANNTSVDKIRIAIHGAMISEWYIFLDDVFGEAILYNLKNNNISVISKIKLEIDFSYLNPTTVDEMRESISDAAKKTLSFLISYKQKLQIVKQLFVSSNSDNKLVQEMKKHVQIRHIFQHHRGVVRKTDLSEIGRENQPLKILNDEGKPIECREDDPIALSKREIENLYEVIKEYSQNFQTLKESP